MKTTSFYLSRILFLVFIVSAFFSLPAVCLAGVISGTVMAENSTGLAGVCVRAYSSKCYEDEAGETTSGADGRYSITISDSISSVYLEANPSCGQLNFTREWYDSGSGTPDCYNANTVNNGAADINFVLEATGSISGRITDAAGQPIANLPVDARSEACGGQWLEGANTDENGFYNIEGVIRGQVYLRTDAASNGFNYIDESWNDSPDCSGATEVTVSPGAETTNRDFQLASGGTISGYVYQQDGTTPISGINVNIFSDYCHNGHINELQTDENGFFEFIGLPIGGQFILSADAQGIEQNYIGQWYNSVPDSQDCSLATAVVVGESIAFNLVEGAGIVGQVNDESGLPIVGVHVFATDTDTGNWIGGVNTEADGSFHLSGLPAVDCRVHVCPTCSDLVYVDEFYKDTYFYHAAAILSLTTGNNIVLDEIRLSAANTICGAISGLDPDQHVQVNAIDDGGTPDWEDDLYFSRGYQANSSGNVVYSLNVLPGRSYRIEASPDDDPVVYYLDGNPNGTLAWGQASNVDPATNPDTIDVEITQGVHLSGTINGLAENQHLGISVGCENGTPFDNSDDLNYWADVWGSGGSTDVFSVSIPSGFTYRICFHQDNGISACFDGTPDGSFGHVDPNVPVDGDTNLAPLTLTEGVEICGTVNNLDPYQHVRILAHSGTDTPEGTDDFTREIGLEADDVGQVHYSLIVPIHYGFIVEFQPEYWPSLFYQSGNPNGTNDWSHATQIVANVDTCGIDLALPATGSIAGRVLSEGQPVSGLWVEVWSNACWDGWLNGGYTDENGYFTVENLPVGDVYVRTCAECDQKNFIDRWHAETGGTEDCNYASPVSVGDDTLTADIHFDLPIGPRYLNWWEIAIYDGLLGAGFDMLPGFNPFLVSAVLEGPNGFSYTFDLDTDILHWPNECSYIDAWFHDFSGPFDYGDYSLTLNFKNGIVKTYTHTLVQVDLIPVDSASRGYTVNPDGSIDFSWTNPDPNQRYQVRIYQGNERLYRSGMLDADSLHVSAESLKCLAIGGDYTYEIRAYDNHDPYYACERGDSLPLTYDPGSLEDRAKWFSATNYLGTGNAQEAKLAFYFDARPGSRDYVSSATMTGPPGFIPYDVDLTNDWYDISTESRSNRGWSRFLPVPVLDGLYTLTVTFNDDATTYTEVEAYELSAASLSAVDPATMNHQIYENGAMQFFWDLPAGATGQCYNIRIRSTDGTKEFVQSVTQTDATQMYLSPWDLRALVHGQTFHWFVHTTDASGGSWIRSDPITFVYDPFQMFPKADIDKDGDVDGWDLAEIVRMIQEGEIDDVGEAVQLLSEGYGRIQ